MEQPSIKRRPSRAVRVGTVTIGGGAPVSVQGMTKTRTADVEATVAQVQALAAAGADLVRLAVPSRKDTAALRRIIPRSPVPIIADVHFHPDRALEAIDKGVAKIRLNPGTISDHRQVRRTIAAAADAGVAIRVGVNEGSIIDRTDSSRRAAELARPLDELMIEKLAEYLEVFHQERFENLVLSAKSHDAFTTVAACRRIAQRWNYPIHVGVTHSGTPETGTIRSAAALGALLSEGIGDTIRISYAGDPLREVFAALELLYSLRLRDRVGAELIACPTCGRAKMDVVRLAEKIRHAIAGLAAPITVAVMGCVVNGPGEAAHADVAICAGDGKALLYRKGKVLRTVRASQIVKAVVVEAERAAAEKSAGRSQD